MAAHIDVTGGSQVTNVPKWSLCQSVLKHSSVVKCDTRHLCQSVLKYTSVVKCDICHVPRNTKAVWLCHISVWRMVARGPDGGAGAGKTSNGIRNDVASDETRSRRQRLVAASREVK